MPDNPTVLIVLGLAAAAVIVFLALKGKPWKVTKSKDGLSVSVEEPAQPRTVKVAAEAKLEKVEAGDIAGVKSTGAAAGAGSAGVVEVFERGTIKDSKIGDIVGEKHEGSARKE
ncbi:MAG: hypothetical protein HY822_17310 [Acidobacteria bacterium]|nr:hypothetical protein [Acidobacteriota bacterium]